MGKLDLDKTPFSFCPKCEMHRPEAAGPCGGCQQPIPARYQNLSYEKALYLQTYHRDINFALYGKNSVTRDHVHRSALLYVEYARKRISNDQFMTASQELNQKLSATMAKRSRGCASTLLITATISAAIYCTFLMLTMGK